MKNPVTVQEMDRIAKSIGVKSYNDKAMKQVCLLVRLGYTATFEMYQREFKLADEAQKRREQAESTRIAEWLDDGMEASPFISGGEVLYPSHASNISDEDMPF